MQSSIFHHKFTFEQILLFCLFLNKKIEIIVTI